MKHYQSVIVMIVLVSFIAGCATSYKPIQLADMSYEMQKPSEKYTIEVVDNLLLASNNQVYHKHATNSNLQLYGVKVTNQTDQPLQITYNNFQVYAGGEKLRLARLESSVKSLKQAGAIYMLWGLLWIGICSENGCVPIPIGLVIGGMNWGTAASSNSKIQQDIVAYSLIGKTVNPGEQVTGIIGLNTGSSLELSFEIVQ